MRFGVALVVLHVCELPMSVKLLQVFAFFLEVFHFSTNSDDGNTYPAPYTKISASNISFDGESREGVIITNFPDGAGTYSGQYGQTSVYDGIGKSDVLQIQGNVEGLCFQDVTVKSGLGDALGRNIAVQDKGKKNIYKNVKLWGYQDTWTSNNDNGLYYFEGGLVRGRTDFLCGKGDIFFNETEIQVCMNTGGYIAVPSKSSSCKSPSQ